MITFNFLFFVDRFLSLVPTKQSGLTKRKPLYLRLASLYVTIYASNIKH